MCSSYKLKLQKQSSIFPIHFWGKPIKPSECPLSLPPTQKNPQKWHIVKFLASYVFFFFSFQDSSVNWCVIYTIVKAPLDKQMQQF